MKHFRTILLLTAVASLPACQHAQPPAAVAGPAVAASQPAVDPAIAMIRQEGLQHSQVDQTLDYLCNVIGQRLTASPSQKRASEWTRDTLANWGLVNAHVEPWGPFGRGWSLEQYSLQVTQPYPIILHGYPKAWSPGLDQPLEDAEVIYIDAKNKTDLAQYAGKLKGKVVLIGAVRPTDAHFKPDATRMTADELSKMAADPGRSRREMLQSAGGPPGRPTTRPGGAGSRPSMLAQNAAYAFSSDELNFVAKEGAAVVIDASRSGDGGTLFVQSARVPGPYTGPSTTQSTTASTTAATTSPATRPSAWAVDAPTIPAEITLATEDFNRLVRMVKLGQQIKVALNLKVKFYAPADVMTANTIAEIPGSDLKDQIVMVGAHLDSWHSGTGATDNGVGSACAMEAVRIIQSLHLHPRRTIRVALWTGEEQGIFGSAYYVKDHFGTLPDDEEQRAARAERFRSRRAATSRATTRVATNPSTASTTTSGGLTTKPEYEKLSVYFNLDNGSGKIRGVFAQQNAAAIPLFRAWLKPFADLDAGTLTMQNTGSTDHIPFDHIGLPGFQFIQDPIEYSTRTHHSNEDVFDRIQIDDMKQASTIMAAFLWDAANMDQRFPRKARP